MHVVDVFDGLFAVFTVPGRGGRGGRQERSRSPLFSPIPPEWARPLGVVGLVLAVVVGAASLALTVGCIWGLQDDLVGFLALVLLPMALSGLGAAFSMGRWSLIALKPPSRSQRDQNRFVL